MASNNKIKWASYIYVVFVYGAFCVYIYIQGGPNSKPLPNYQKNALNRIKVSKLIRFLRQIK